jgi:hypothetical protein
VKVRGQESEATRHTAPRPDRDIAVVRQFSHWLSHSQLDKVSRRSRQRPARPTRISRQHSFRPQSDGKLTQHPQAVVVMDFCLFLLASTAPSPSGDTAGAVFFPLAVSHRSLRRSTSPNEFIAEIGPGWGQWARGREAAARRADAACPMTRPQDGAADWSMGFRKSRGRWHGCRLSGPTHERAAGDREDQACHRRHREG